MGRKTLDQCRSGKDILNWAERNERAYVKYGGRHAKVVGPNGGIVPVPTHPGDLPRGTLRSIIKMLRAVGLALIPLAGIGWILSILHIL